MDIVSAAAVCGDHTAVRHVSVAVVHAEAKEEAEALPHVYV